MLAPQKRIYWSGSLIFDKNIVSTHHIFIAKCDQEFVVEPIVERRSRVVVIDETKTFGLVFGQDRAKTQQKHIVVVFVANAHQFF